MPGMPETTRLDEELADTLALTQTVRSAAAQARAHLDGGKLAKRLSRIDDELAAVQERVNELVVATPAKRHALTGRSRRLRDAEQSAQGERNADADVLDALQALAAETAYAVAQWTVVKRLAKASGHKPASKLAKWALPAAEEHLTVALEGVDRQAKRQAAKLSG